MSDRGADDVELVIAAQQGDGDAFTVLYDRWFDRVHDVSRRVLRDPELAAEVTQDVFLTTWRQLGTLRQPESFGGWLLRASRNRSLNRLERERRSVAMGDEETVMEIDHQATGRGGHADQPADALARNEQEEMLWAAAAALGDRDASILHLHLRHGLDGAELAEELDVSPNAANQAMFRMRTRLGGAIRAWVLWRHGHPACERLDEVLTTAGISHFGADAVRAVNAHADDCERCGRHRAVLVAPEAMFAAVPILAAPAGLKARVAGALEADGVPISSSRLTDPTTVFTTVPATSGATEANDDPTSVVAAATPPPEDASSKRRALVLLALLLLLAGGGTLAWMLGGEDDDPEPVAAAAPDSQTTDSQSTTTEEATSTTEAGTTTSESTTTTEATTTTMPTTTSTSTTSTTTTTVPAAPPPPPPPPPPPAPPTITSFTADRVGWADRPANDRCLSPSQHIRLIWTTADATSVTISGPNDPPGPLPTSGSTYICHQPPGDYTMLASGPGGTSTPTTRSVPAG